MTVLSPQEFENFGAPETAFASAAPAAPAAPGGLSEAEFADAKPGPQGWARAGADAAQLGIGAGEGLISGIDTAHPGAFIPQTINKVSQALGSDFHWPTFAETSKYLLGKINANPDQYPAQGLEQKLFRTTGEFLGNPLTYTGAGGIGQKVAMAIPSAIGSELAGTAAEGTRWELPARILGAASVPATVSAARRVVDPRRPISPENAAARDALAREGIETSAGQVTGAEALRYKEATSGYQAQRLTERQQRQLTQAALRQIGETGDNVQVAIGRARPRIGAEIEDAASRMSVRLDRKLNDDIVRIKQGLLKEGLDDAQVNRITAQINNVLDGFNTVGKTYRGRPDTLMPGTAFHNLVRHGSPLQRVIASTDASLSYYGNRIRDALMDAAERTSKGQGTQKGRGRQAAWQDLRDARRQWKNLLALEDVAASRGAEPGQLTPAMVRRAATFHEKTDYSRGRSDFADLARNANTLMYPLPQSGTAPRMQLGTRAIGAGIGSMLFGGPFSGGLGVLGAGIGGWLAPMIEGRVVMTPWMQRYLQSGARQRLPWSEHATRAGRAAAAAGSPYATEQP